MGHLLRRLWPELFRPRGGYTATYIINHPEFGWQAFGGNVKVSGGQVTVQPRDSFRQRIYIAPLGLWLTLDSGTFDSVEVKHRRHAVRPRSFPPPRRMDRKPACGLRNLRK